MKPPQLERTELANGLKILFLHTPTDPISACHLFLPTGTATEPAAQSGVTSLMSGLLTKGTLQKSARQIAEEVEGIGGSLGAGVAPDYFDISSQSASEYFVTMLQMMADVCFEPAFNSAEVEKERLVHLAGIESKKESIFTVTHELLNENLFGDHPYARSTSGIKETIQNLKDQDLKDRHKRIFSPRSAILSLASSLPLKELKPILEQIFGHSKWPSSAELQEFRLKPPADLTEKKTINNSSPFEQAYFMIGFPAPAVQSADYPVIKVLNGILGGGMSSRLFQNLREKKALAYDVGSFYPSRKERANFVIYIGLKPERMKEAQADIEEEIRKIQVNSIPEEEMLHTIRHLKGSYILDHQTNSQRAHYLGWWDILGPGAAYDRTYIECLDKVTTEQIHLAAKKYFSQPSVTVVTIPNAKENR